jgi:nucleoside phosphorylase
VSIRVVCALRVEAFALRGLPVTRTGMGREHVRAARASNRLLLAPGDEAVVAGFCGAADPGLAPGDVVVATRVRSADGELPCAPVEPLTERLRRHGLRVTAGPLYTADRILGPAERRDLGDAVAVDMESYWVAEATPEATIAVVRVVVDTASRRLLDPRTLPAGLRAYRALRRVAAALREAAASGIAEQLRY